MSLRIPYRRLLVIGSWGQLGSELHHAFGNHSVGLDLPDFDITDRDAVLAAIKQHRPDIVINTAAFTQVDLAETESERCRAINVRGVENLLEACLASGASIVQVSTDYVFDGTQNRPYSEADEPNPRNTYGRAKWEAEQIVSQYPHHLIVRTAGLFGAGGPNATPNFVDTMVKLAKKGTPLRVIDDQTTSLAYARDLALAMKALIESGSGGLYHVANSGAASWYQFAVEIFRIAGLEPEIRPISMADYRCKAERPRFSVLDTEKYSITPGHFPMPSWQDALAAYFARRSRQSSC